jgi:hypothetical protein
MTTHPMNNVHKLTIRDGALYVGNYFFCYAETGNERASIPPGRFEVIHEFSHVHREPLLNAIGIGWIGASTECDIVLGRVRGVRGVIPSRADFGRLCAMVETAIEQDGRSVVLEVK